MSDHLHLLQKAQHITKCLQLAMLLEVSVQKPGNVSFNANFEKTRVEHFLASAVAAGPSLQQAASRGTRIAEGQLRIESLGIGELIKTCSEDVASWQHGGNTILGTIMLFVPLATAAGMTPTEKEGCFDFSVLRRNLDLVVRASSAQDAVHLYEAIDIACPSGLGGAPDFDVTQTDSKKRLTEENVSLFEVFKLASAYDDICYEWINNYPITFDLAYPYLTEQLRNKPLNTAVVHTFLKILSERSDTFIARKMGNHKAQEISKEAKTILELGGTETTKGRGSLAEFDKNLRASGNACNPGTTADLTATALAFCILNGYRP